jgi:hypothetical protein
MHGESPRRGRSGGIRACRPIKSTSWLLSRASLFIIAVDLDNEIDALHKYVRDLYAPKFPELESLILNPVDYARVVLRIGNEMDITQVDLSGILPNATIM